MVKQHIKFDHDTEGEPDHRLPSKNPFTLPGSAKSTNGSGRTASPSITAVKRRRAVDFFDESEPAAAIKEKVTNGSRIPHDASKRDKLLQDRAQLPISKHGDMLRRKVNENSVIILLGETGSGKSTQLPQFLLDLKLEGAIAITQPRRVAATNLARRVADEMDVVLGKEVGYSIRFDDTSSKHTKIKYLTDGMLLIEIMRDPLLSRYSIVVLDEAHERSLLTDLLLGFMKRLLKRRMGMKVVVMSATLDAQKFSQFFDDAEIVEIEGRTFPVELYYTKEPQADYLDAVLKTIFQIHMAQPTGDILCFLTGSEEIENTATIARKYAEQLPKEVPGMIVLPLYASLAQAEQAKVFASAGRNRRKIILATNIAETSITVPGVRYVIDTGLQKVKALNTKLGFESLEVSPIAKSNADQRAGRAGREAAGKCWRLYQESTYDSLPKAGESEIKRIELAQAVLALKARGIDDIVNFDYFEPPTRESLMRALEQLYALGALDDAGRITKIGTTMSTIPLTPGLSRVLLAAKELDCVDAIIDIVSCLSVTGIFIDRADQRDSIAESRRRFEAVEGDHMTLLNILTAYREAEDQSSWCAENYIDKRAMRTILDIRRQLTQHANRTGMPLSGSRDMEAILRAFLSGFIAQTAFLCADGSYRTTSTNAAVSIHPSSVLYGRKVDAIVFHESVFTTRLWVRGVSRVEPKWVQECSPSWTGRRGINTKE